MKKIIYLLLSLFIANCSTTKQLNSNDKVYEIANVVLGDLAAKNQWYLIENYNDDLANYKLESKLAKWDNYDVRLNGVSMVLSRKIFSKENVPYFKKQFGQSITWKMDYINNKNIKLVTKEYIDSFRLKHKDSLYNVIYNRDEIIFLQHPIFSKNGQYAIILANTEAFCSKMISMHLYILERKNNKYEII